MVFPPLACSVRACGRPLARDGARVVCAAGHAFDVARSGYLSLMQPHDRRSAAPGDAKESVAARARLLQAGIGRAAIDAIVAVAPGDTQPVVATDLGCGSGELLGALTAARDVCGVGIDLSTAAVERAARRYPSLIWIAANADRRLPLLDASVHLVLSLNGRRNPDECARVLVPGGALIVGVPAADDLLELRAEVQGEGIARERTDAVVAAHASAFSLVERFTVRERHRLDGAALRDVLRGTYRGARVSALERVEALHALDVTLATEICRFSRAGDPDSTPGPEP